MEMGIGTDLARTRQWRAHLFIRSDVLTTRLHHSVNRNGAVLSINVRIHVQYALIIILSKQYCMSVICSLGNTWTYRSSYTWEGRRLSPVITSTFIDTADHQSFQHTTESSHTRPEQSADDEWSNTARSPANQN